MWTTDVDQAVEDDYWGADEPPDWVVCTPEQAALLDRRWPGRRPLGYLEIVIREEAGRHSRPELLADPDRKGRITP